MVQINSGARPYLPYTIGLLQATLEKQAPGRYHFLPLVSEFDGLLKSTLPLKEAHIVGFSLYTWNEQRSLAMAHLLKKLNPRVVIVCGGPQVPDKAENYLREHPYLDLVCHGEGESVFCQIVEALSHQKWDAIPGISYMQGNTFFHHPPEARRKNLSELPSPYLSGVFDAMIHADPNKVWAALWETNRGCPFSCTFCDWGSATASKVNRFDLARLKSEIDWFAKHKLDYIFCCDANFGLLPRDIEIATYAAEVRQKTGYPLGLVVQNSKNVTDRAFEVHRILAEAQLDTVVTLSLQSLNPDVLKAVKRDNISLAHYQELQNRLMQANIKTYTDLILGLPHETLDSFIDGFCELLERGQYHSILVFIAGILPNAVLASQKDTYGLKTVKTRCVYVHTPVVRNPEISEFQELVVGTDTMPKPDWVKGQAFAWMAQFLMFTPGVLRMPLIFLNYLDKVPYRHSLRLFMTAPDSAPLLQQVWQFFTQKSTLIQQGDVEHCCSTDPRFEGKWWTPDEFALRQLVFQGQLKQLYQEAQELFFRQLMPSPTHQQVYKEAFAFSKTFVEVTFKLNPPPLTLNFNLWEVYQGLLQGKHLEVKPKRVLYEFPTNYKRI